MSENRTTSFCFESLSKSFNGLEGYWNLDNSDIGNALKSWDFLKEENRENEEIIASYQKWSFTASFLQLINAWQWFFSGLLIGRQADLPAQMMQMYYYSIFFSYGSFLSAQFKGHYTLKTEIKKTEIEDTKVKKTRKEAWIGKDANGKSCIYTEDIGRGGEHANRANWFYATFEGWDFKSSYPDVLSFKERASSHSHFRNRHHRK